MAWRWLQRWHSDPSPGCATASEHRAVPSGRGHHSAAGRGGAAGGLQNMADLCLRAGSSFFLLDSSSDPL